MDATPYQALAHWPLAVMGCGAMGTAIIKGLLEAMADTQSADGSVSAHNIEPKEQQTTRFIACVRTTQSAARLTATFSLANRQVEVLVNDNISAARRAKTILLACKPWALPDLLGQDGMSEATRGKLIISVLIGTVEGRIQELLHGPPSVGISSDQSRHDRYSHIVCAMPNISCQIRRSITIVPSSSQPLPQALDSFVIGLFSALGPVKTVPRDRVDAASVLCAAGPAFAALFIDALATSAESYGFNAEESTEMASRAIFGAVEMVLAGMHPQKLIETIATQGGVTASGLDHLAQNRFCEIVGGALSTSLEKAIAIGRRS